MQATAPEVIQHASSEASFGRTTTPSFALATPYTGGNLGDGAIMDAVISNIRRRLPDAPIYGITMHPVDTLQRHGMPSYPISGATLTDFWVAPQAPAESMRAENHRASGKKSVRAPPCEMPGERGDCDRPFAAPPRLALDDPRRGEPYYQRVLFFKECRCFCYFRRGSTQ